MSSNFGSMNDDQGGFWNNVSNFFMGTPGKFRQGSTLTPQQQTLFSQLLRSISGEGGGGAFGEAGDYYRSLLSDNPATFEQMAAPEMRRFREQIIPDLAEQFAGMGSGGLASSGFRNAAIGAGTDLSERLGALRAQLRQQGAAGLMGLGQEGLQRTTENVYQKAQPGFLSNVAPVAGTVLGGWLGGPAGATIGGKIGSAFSRTTSPGQEFSVAKGSTSPYGTELGWGPAGFYPKEGNYNPYTDE